MKIGGRAPAISLALLSCKGFSGERSIFIRVAALSQFGNEKQKLLELNGIPVSAIQMSTILRVTRNQHTTILHTASQSEVA